MAVIHLGVAGALSTFNCSNYLIICSGEVVKPWHFTFSLGICICGIYQSLYLVNTEKNNSVNPVFQLQSLHCYWFLTLGYWAPCFLSLHIFVRGFLFKMNPLSYEFPGETGGLKRMCWVIFLQANPIKLEVTLQRMAREKHGLIKQESDLVYRYLCSEIIVATAEWHFS